MSTFAERLSALAQRAATLVDHVQTEEATKNAFVMPFLAALGYDVFNPQEVVPELTADVGTKKGEKVDYAIKREGEVIMLVECKHAGQNLKEANMSQLFRYFTVTHARIAILTNGIEYRFYSDLEEPNKMDERPFLVLDLLDLRENLIHEVAKLSKEQFNLEQMLATASDLKYLRGIRRVLSEQFEEPAEDFVRFFFSEVVPGGRFIQSAREQFTPLVQRALSQVVSERVSSRLRSALAHEDPNAQPQPIATETVLEETEPEKPDNGIVTTEEELEGYHIVRAIVREVVDASRVAHRDTKSYFGILLDDNNRKPICRLHFNYSQLYLGLFDQHRNEERIPIDAVDDIYQYADRLKAAAQMYDET